MKKCHFFKINKPSIVSWAGLIVSGGSGTKTSIESFPAKANCIFRPFPSPGNLLYSSRPFISSQGRVGHSLSVINEGQTLVACGGTDATRSCISWKSGQVRWTHYATLRFCILYLLFVQVGASSEVCKLLVSSGQWKDGEVDQGKSYAELWVMFYIVHWFR